MSPEQHRDGKQADVRSDVWGLGVTLYELLTLQRAFGTGQAVLETDPIPPRQLNPILDRDLDAVVLKALRKEPVQRYTTAGELAADLARWLNAEPVTARPAHAPRRAVMWARRNKGYALAISLVLLGLVGVTAGALAFGQVQRREALLQTLQRIQLAPRIEGWSDRLLGLAGKARGRGRGTDTQVQAQAVAALEGFDSRPVRTFPFRATALDFNPHTGHLWIAPADRPVQEWDPETNVDREAGPDGRGEFAFGRDGPILVAPAADGRSLEVHEAQTGRLLRTLVAPLDGWDKAELVNQALTRDGARVAASFRGNGARGIVAAWDADSGAVLKAVPIAEPSEVALAPDGVTLAAADEAGVVHVGGISRRARGRQPADRADAHYLAGLWPRPDSPARVRRVAPGRRRRRRPGHLVGPCPENPPELLPRLPLCTHPAGLQPRWTHPRNVRAIPRQSLGHPDRPPPPDHGGR